MTAKEVRGTPSPDDIKTERRLLQTSSSDNSTSNSTANSTNGTEGEENSTEAEEAAAYQNLTSYQKMFSSYEAAGKFKENDIGNSMLGNFSINICILFVGTIWYFLTSVLCGGCINPRSNFFVRLLAYSGERCFFLGVMVNLLELSIYSTNNIMNPSIGSPISILSLVMSLVTALFVLLFPGAIALICRKHYQDLWHPDYYERYAYLFCEFKLDRTVSSAV